MLKFDLSFFCTYGPYNHPQSAVPHKTMAVHGAWHATLRLFAR